MYTYLSELDRIMALEIAGNGQTYFHLNPRDAFPTTSELQLTAYNIAISELSYIYGHRRGRCGVQSINRRGITSTAKFSVRSGRALEVVHINIIVI